MGSYIRLAEEVAAAEEMHLGHLQLALALLARFL
jgi:hypothetical protein